MSVTLHGPNSGQSFTVTDGDAARFWARVEKRDEGCWLWRGYINPVSGYGQFVGSWRKAPTVAHRISWTIANGPIPIGLSICHTCDNTLCVRPDHLFLGTHAENMADMDAKGRRMNGVPRRQCAKGHYFTANNAIKPAHDSAIRNCAICILLAEQDRSVAIYETARREYAQFVADVVSPVLPTIATATRVLTQRELDVVARAFGVYGRDPEPLSLLGYIHGVSRQRIEQIRDAAMTKLGMPLDILDRQIALRFGRAAAELNVIPTSRVRRRKMVSVTAA